MQGFIAESFYGAYVKNRSERCKYYKYKYVINWVYEACLENVIVGLFFNQSVVVVKIRQFRVGLRGVRVCVWGGGGGLSWRMYQVLIAQIKAAQ